MQNSVASIQKALYWLSSQDENWTRHIKDSNIAVQMHTKAQAQKEVNSSFQKKIESFCKEPAEDQLTQLNSIEISSVETQLNPTPLRPPQNGREKQELPQSPLNPALFSSPQSSPQNPTTDSYEKFKAILENSKPTQLEAPIPKTSPIKKRNIKNQPKTLPEEILSSQTRVVEATKSNKTLSKKTLSSQTLKPETSVRIDSRNLQILEHIQKEWNLKNKEETLNLLIQAGKKKLSTLKN